MSMFNNNNSNKSLSRVRRDQNPWSYWQHEMSNLFDRFNRDLSPSEESLTRFPKIEITEDEKKLTICAEVPGMNEKDVNVTLKDNQLIIEGERKTENKSEKDGRYHSEFSYGSFYRSIPLMDEIKEDSVKATYKDGMLRVELQKSNSAHSNTKKIPITRS